MLARGNLEFIKQSPSDYYRSKVHDTHDVCCDNKEGGLGGGASPPRRWYGNTNFNPQLTSTSNATGFRSCLFCPNFEESKSLVNLPSEVKQGQLSPKHF